jgi:outer membrane cobalamin receptor
MTSRWIINPACATTVMVLILPFMTPLAHGADGAGEIEELIVYGRAQQQLGTAQAASQGQVGYDDIRLPPLFRTGELVEAIPGMVATQHSGTGKANQYFLRGFNLDHGTDFSVHVEGVPINMRTHGHGQGYLDLNFMIPELVRMTRYRKGPYSAQVGDFSSAGSAEFSLYETLPENLALLTLGDHNYARGLVGGSAELGPGTFTGALTGTTYDGKWDEPENLEQLKFYGSYAFDTGAGRTRISLMGYDGSWDSTDQIPQRAVDAGLISRFGAIDPTLGGQTERFSLTANSQFDTWDLAAYVIDYDFTLWGNFTYFLDRPITGDQVEQRDDRTIWGARFDAVLESFRDRENLIFRWGGDLRYDDIREVGLYASTARVRNETLRNDAVELLSLSGYGEAEILITERFRTVLGLRGDWFDWDVTANVEENSGTGNDGLLAPKVTASYRFTERLEGYANWGRGFHSNDVRGATITLGPDGNPTETSPVIVDSEGAEIGTRFEHGNEFNATAVLFTLELDSELIYVGDSAATEPNDATRRTGIELTAFWQITDWLAMHSEYTFTDAEFKEDQGGGKEVPGAVESTFVLGANAQWNNGWDASARLRYLGEAPLVEDGSVRSADSLVLNAGVGYERGPFRLRLDVFNLLDSKEDDISYFYASRLPDEPAEGVEDIHFHPLEPRTIRGTITVRW